MFLRTSTLLVALSCAGRAWATSSPLADAAEKSEHATLRLLLDAKHSDVNAAQPDGMTAVHWAAYLQDWSSAEALVKAGADVKATNHYGVTPLSLACQNTDPRIVTLLLEHGADPNAALRGGETPLMTAARTGISDSVKALLQYGADVNAAERRGQTALMWAAAEGHADVVSMLVEAGANIRVTLPDSGFNPFLFAVREGRIDAARALLKAGAEVNGVMQPKRPTGKGPRKGTSALILAVENGHFALADVLLQAGADPNDQRSGFTPLHALTWVRKPNRGDSDDGEPPPIGSGDMTSLQLVRKLVEHGADVNARLTKGGGGPGLYKKVGATPFLMAAGTDDVPYLRLLIELGADPALPNADGCTPLIAACGVGIGGAEADEVAGTEPEVLETVKLLLDHGADINAVDANGETAMHGAAYKNMPKVLQFLVSKGAKIDIWNRKNKYGWTPLLIAQGYRPGNFKPSAETTSALLSLMQTSGVAESITRPLPDSKGDPQSFSR